MTLKVAVLGSPVSHSLSPTLHNAAYRVLGLDIQYTAIQTSTDQLAERINELGSDYLGYSLTMPLKQEVLTLVSNQSRLVEQTGCANTVYRDAHGQWALENTDVFGITETIRQADFGPLKSACIIGSGATARSALSALANLGIREVTIFARNREAVAILRGQSEPLGIDIQAIDLEREITFTGDLVISTVPSTAQTQVIDSLIANQTLPALLDIAYNPWPSDLARYWVEHGGGPVLSGIEMLLWQATVQVELFTGRSAPIEAMRTALPEGLWPR